MHQQGPGLEKGTRAFSFPTTSGTPNAFTHRWSCCGDHTWGQARLRQGGPPPQSLARHLAFRNPRFTVRRMF